MGVSPLEGFYYCVWYAGGFFPEIRSVNVCVRVDHKEPHPKDVINEVLFISTYDVLTKVLVIGGEYYDVFCLFPDG